MSLVITLILASLSSYSVLCLVDESNTFCQRLELNNCSKLINQHSDQQAPDTKQTVYFGLMLAFPDPLKRPSFVSAFDDGHNIAPAAYTAVEQINNQPDLLSEYTIELVRLDGGCYISGRTVLGMNELTCICEPIVGIIGPSCGNSAEIVSRTTGTDQFAMVSLHYGEKEALGDRSKYPYAFGVLGSSSIFAKAFEELMKYNHWRKIALLWDDSSVDGHDISQHVQRFIGNSDEYEIMFGSRVSKDNIPINELIYYYVRVIIIIASPEVTLRTLCLAHHSGLVHPKCQWIFKERISADFHEVSFSYHGVQYSCSETDISSSLRGNINLVFNAVSEPVSDNIESGINVAYKEYLMQYDQQRELYTQRFNVTSTQTPWAKGIFDAVWLLALALNDSLHELNFMDITKIAPGNVFVAQTLQHYLLKRKFRGISGCIKFDNETGFNINSQINILQYGGLNNDTTIGFYVNRKLTLHTHTNPVFVNATFAEEIERINIYILVLFYVTTFVILLLVLPVHLVTIIYRNHKAIKASSPRLNHLIFLGCYLILIGTSLFIVLHTTDSGPRSTLCVAIPWIITPGTTLITGTVCMKTWRLYRIHSASKRFLIINTNQKKLCMSDSMLCVGVAVLVAVDIVVCLIWTISDPLKEIRYKKIIQNDNQSLPVIQVDAHCESSEHTLYWSIAIVAYKGILTLGSLILAVGTRMKQKEFNTKNVVVLAYALSIVVGLGVPLHAIFAIIHVSGSLQLIALCVLLNTVVVVCLVVLFYPAVFLLFLS